MDERGDREAPQAGGTGPGDEVDALLGLVVELAERSIAPAAAASITVVRDAGPATLSASHERARRLDEAQYASGRGPCLAAATEWAISNVVVADAAARWPEFAQAAVADAIASVLSVPFTPGTTLLGSLNVYSEAPEPFEGATEWLALRFARQAEATLATAASLSAERRVADELREALNSRDLIGQAKGILMVRERCDAEQAFDILRRASQRTNRKLRDVAADLVDATKRHGRAR